ncbi:MAG: hypothetical protein E6H60_11935, partial [Betaproteobacteria bacterium]
MRLNRRESSRSCSSPQRVEAGSGPASHRAVLCAALVTLLLLTATDANAALPRAVARAFLDEGIPLSAVSVYVREAGAARPLISHRPGKPMNPASTMKLVTTFAALELLGP